MIRRWRYTFYFPCIYLLNLKLVFSFHDHLKTLRNNEYNKTIDNQSYVLFLRSKNVDIFYRV